MVRGVHVSSVADDVVVTLATHFIRTKCEKCFNFFLCDKLNKDSLEGSRRFSKEGKKLVNQYWVRDTLLNCPFFLSVG